MKPAAIGVGAGLALALIAALAPWRMPGEQIRAQIQTKALALLGMKAKLPEKVTFSLLPRPRIKLQNVTFRRSDGAVTISSRSLKGDLKLFDLVLGKVELASITLYEPHIEIHAARFSADSQLPPSQSVPPPPSKAHWISDHDLPGLRLVDGRLALQRKDDIFSIYINNLNGRFDWSAATGPATLSASGVWRGQAAHITAWLGKPLNLLRGGASPLKASAEADLLSAKFDGTLMGGDNWRLNGDAEASTPALRPFADWISYQPPSIPRDFGKTTLSGRLTANADGLSLADLAFSGGGSDCEGEAALRLSSPRPVLAATLASNTLVLTPFIESLPPLFDGSGSWSATPFNRHFAPFDLDLRVSASRARLLRLELQDLGLAVLLQGDRLDLSMPEAKLYGGAIQAQTRIKRSDDGETLHASGSFSKVEASNLLWDAAMSDALSGPASGDFNVTSRGDSVTGLVRNLTGEAKFKVGQGEMFGVNFEQALRRISTRPLSVAAEVHGGQTTFDRFSGEFLLGNDAAQLKNVEISGPGVLIKLTGSTLLAERALDVDAVAEQAGSDGTPSPGGSSLTLKLQGFWDEPRLVLDPESLMRRSEAAAPLFEESSTSAAPPTAQQ